VVAEKPLDFFDMMKMSNGSAHSLDSAENLNCGLLRPKPLRWGNVKTHFA
jgi:hypothetical protein